MKIIKSRIFAFVLGAVIFSGITGVTAYTILASDVGFTPKNNSWKVDNIGDAIDDLYEKTKNYKNLSTPTDVEANYLLNGKKAYKSNGTLVTGSIPIITAENKNLASGENYTIPQGYHDGTGTVTAPASQYTLTDLGAADSRQARTFNATGIPGWQNFTADNFVMTNVYLFAVGNSDYLGYENCYTTVKNLNLISYNSSTGIVTVAASIDYNGGTSNMLYYRIKCIH